MGLECIKYVLAERDGSITVSTKTYAPLLNAIVSCTYSLPIDTSFEEIEFLYMLSQCVTFSKRNSVNEEDHFAKY